MSGVGLRRLFFESTISFCVDPRTFRTNSSSATCVLDADRAVLIRGPEKKFAEEYVLDRYRSVLSRVLEKGFASSVLIGQVSFGCDPRTSTKNSLGSTYSIILFRVDPHTVEGISIAEAGQRFGEAIFLFLSATATLLWLYDYPRMVRLRRSSGASARTFWSRLLAMPRSPRNPSATPRGCSLFTASSCMTGILPALISILFHGLAFAMVLYIVSVGLSLTMGLMGFVNLAHGAFAMAGGYIAVTLMNTYQVPFGFALLAAFIVVALISAVLERTLYARLYGARRTGTGAVHHRPDLHGRRRRAQVVRPGSAADASAGDAQRPARSRLSHRADVPRVPDCRRASG